MNQLYLVFVTVQCGRARSHIPAGVNPAPARQASHWIEDSGLAELKDNAIVFRSEALQRVFAQCLNQRRMRLACFREESGTPSNNEIALIRNMW
jgi:hypothetical protein